MASIQQNRPSRKCRTSLVRPQWRVVLLLLSLSIQSFVFSAVPTNAPDVSSTSNTTSSRISGEQSPTTMLVLPSTTHEGAGAAAAETTTNQPEEIIFITSTKKVEKDTRHRQLKPVYYGTPSGEEGML